MLYGILTVSNNEEFNIYISALKEAGYFVKNVETGSQALQTARIEEPDLIVVNKKVSDISGIDLLRLFKQDERLRKVPVFMYSLKRVNSDNMLKAFNVGASDYFSGHIPPALLVARVKAWVQKIDRDVYGMDDGIIQRGIFRVDTYQNIVTAQSKVICFSPTEYRIFYILAKRTDKVLSQDSLIEYLYGDNDDKKIQPLKMHIYRMRKKLAELRNAICTIRGVGYKYSND